MRIVRRYCSAFKQCEAAAVFSVNMVAVSKKVGRAARYLQLHELMMVQLFLPGSDCDHGNHRNYFGENNTGADLDCYYLIFSTEQIHTFHVRIHDFVTTPVSEGQDGLSTDLHVQPKNLYLHRLSTALVH